MTDLQEQAEEWAARQADSRKELGFLNVYEFDREAALSRLSEHQPNNQICILNQEVIEKYLSFKEVITL